MTFTFKFNILLVPNQKLESERWNVEKLKTLSFKDKCQGKLELSCQTIAQWLLKFHLEASPHTELDVPKLMCLKMDKGEAKNKFCL